MRHHLLLGLCAATLIGVAAAHAADEEAAGPSFDVAFGVSAMTDYISRGITQTDHNPAIQGYIEPELSTDVGSFYASILGTNVDFGSPDTEIDLSGGWRPELGPFSFDFGYAHYFYLDDPSSDFGELYAHVNYTANDWLTLGSQIYFAPDWSGSDTEAVYGELNTEISLPANFALSGLIGYQEFDPSYGQSYWTWTAGISWTYKDTVTFDVSYSDTNLSRGECAVVGTFRNACDARVVGTISIDTSWSALKGDN